jgi:hypothetical protein
MSEAIDWRAYLVRLGIVFLIALVFSIGFSEISYRLQREKTDRAPETYQIIIPRGASERVAAGEQVVSIPEDKVFVIGDVLEVVNHDVVDHKLGPVWAPPGKTARLSLEIAEKYSYSCSFVPSKYLGFDVRQPTTLGTRLTALGITTPTTTAFLFIYSLLVYPVNKEEDQNAHLKEGAV